MEEKILSIQQCIIHQIRNSTKFVSYKDIKKLMADLKLVYAAPTEETALNELELFKDKWDSKYPKIYKSWHLLHCRDNPQTNLPRVPSDSLYVLVL